MLMLHGWSLWLVEQGGKQQECLDTTQGEMLGIMPEAFRPSLIELRLYTEKQNPTDALGGREVE